MNNLQLANDLCAVSSALREVRRVHVHSFGALVPHVFMASVLTHVGKCLYDNLGREPYRDCGEVASILDALEDGMANGDRETRNVVAISFVHDSELEPFFNLLRPLMGPKLMVQLRGL